MKLIYFTFVGGYEGAVKLKGRWKRLNRECGSSALHQWAIVNGHQLERVPVPPWTYDQEKFRALPEWLSPEDQEKLANDFHRHSEGVDGKIEQAIDQLLEQEQEQEMSNWFEKRTNNHIRLVQKYCRKIEDASPNRFKGALMAQAETHDSSKFESPEYEPYLYISWNYKCKDDGVDFELPDEMSDKMNQATEHHVKSNSHHPEYHSEQEVDLINRADRDKPPEKMVDATKMPDIDVAEMVADWCAMSEEKGNTPQDWAAKNVNVRWKFTPEQTALIDELMSSVWK